MRSRDSGGLALVRFNTCALTPRAAHALMQAMAHMELCGPPTFSVSDLTERADELLAEWMHQPDLSESSQ